MVRIAALEPGQWAAAIALLDRACAFDRAGVVAIEKLFGTAPRPAAVGAAAASTASTPGVGAAVGAASVGAGSTAAGVGAATAGSGSDSYAAEALGAFDDERLVGVAATCGRYLRVLAVEPDIRRHGIGSALLTACEDAARAAGEPRLRALDQPGNYLAPGIDERNTETIAWLARRGWQRGSDVRTNVLVQVRDNPRVTEARYREALAAARQRGYEVRRARPDERDLLDAVAREFGGAWPFELSSALGMMDADLRVATMAAGGATSGGHGLGSCVHIALRDGAYCAFAAHDGNNRGLGWFGPTGTWPAHRGQGLGEVLLLACLLDVATAHERCEVAWIGPRPFYEKVAGIVAERRFVVMTREFG